MMSYVSWYETNFEPFLNACLMPLLCNVLRSCLISSSGIYSANVQKNSDSALVKDGSEVKYKSTSAPVNRC